MMDSENVAEIPDTNGFLKAEDEGDNPLDTVEKGKWGRAWEVDLKTYFAIGFLLIVCPLMPLYFYICCSGYSGDLLGPFLTEPDKNHTSLQVFVSHIPSWEWEAVLIYAVWIVFQVILAIIPDVLHYVLPYYAGGVQEGAVTPAGKVNKYNINGLQAWLITHILWFANWYGFKLFSPTIIFDNFGPLLWVTNIMGYAIAVFAYVKARLFPTDRDDRKFSGNAAYDFVMGIEFNPRILKWFDLKLFFNGRPGIVAWTLINLSFTAHQLKVYGEVTNSMILLNVLHGMYVLDFFWNETWYLKTLDICHDHFGWMLGWGDCVWLPYMYTLQGLYLAYFPVTLRVVTLVFVSILGLVGYYIFRAANQQKDHFRKERESAIIWGNIKPVIRPVITWNEYRCKNRL